VWHVAVMYLFALLALLNNRDCKRNVCADDVVKMNVVVKSSVACVCTVWASFLESSVNYY